MERTGILLAVAVALCWGSADTVAKVATRRQGTFATTFISLVTSATVLVLLGTLACARLSSPGARDWASHWHHGGGGLLQ